MAASAPLQSRLWRGWLPSGLPGAGHDLTAAFALAAVAIPEQIATARLAGMPPVTGLLVFVAGSLGFFLLGSNRFLSVGADSTIAPVFAASLATLALAGGAHYQALAALLALQVGVIVAAAGLLRLGWVARLLSIPVITGFLAGIAIHIAISQLPALLGIAAGSGSVLSEIARLARNLALANPDTIAVGLGVCAATWGFEKIDIRLPGALIAMIVATLAVRFFGLAGKGVAILGAVTFSGFTPSVPAVTPSEISTLLPIAFIVSLVVMIQTVAVSKSFPEDTGVDGVNRDLVGAGVGSLVSGLVGGFPANASPPRTAIVCESGGTSRFAGFCAAGVVAAFLVFGLNLLAFVPQAALAGLLLFVARRIFHIDVMRMVASQSIAEFALLAITAAAIVVTPIETGVGIGIILSLLHGVWTITQTRAVIFEQVPGTTVWWPTSSHFAGETRPGIVVVGFQAPLFFLNAETFRRTIEKAVDSAPPPVHAIILEAGSIVELDFSGAQILSTLIREWRNRGVVLYVARLELLRAQQAFERFGILAQIGGQRTFHSVDDAVKHIPPI